MQPRQYMQDVRRPETVLTDDSASQGHVAAKVHVAGDGQVVELDDLRDLLEALLELRDLLEVIPKLDHRGGSEHPVLVDDQLPVLERINVALDEEQVRARLHGQEARTRDVHTVAVREVLDGSTGGGLELDDGLAIIRRLGVDDDLELHLALLHNALHG